MDTTKLVVGQEVYMRSGIYGCNRKVVEVTPLTVSVETGAGRFRLDNENKECGNNGEEWGRGTWTGDLPWEITVIESAKTGE
jgi:hypothetical protein